MSTLTRIASSFTFAAIVAGAPALRAQAPAPEAAPAPAAEPPPSSAPPPAAVTAPVAAPAPAPPPVVAPAPAVAAPAPATPPCPDDRPTDRTEGSGVFMIGVGLFDLSKLNDRLAASGYEELDTTQVMLGGEGHAVFESGFVIGGRGAAIIGPEVSGPDDLRLSYGGGFGLAEFGFAFVHTPSVLFMGLGGIGGYGTGIAISDEQDARFDDVLEQPRRSTEISGAACSSGSRSASTAACRSARSRTGAAASSRSACASPDCSVPPSATGPRTTAPTSRPARTPA